MIVNGLFVQSVDFRDVGGSASTRRCADAIIEAP